LAAEGQAAAKPAPKPRETPAEKPRDDSPFVDVYQRPLYLDNLYRGAAAFILLSGPSANLLDLSVLRRRGIFTIGVNQSPSISPVTAWTYVDRPRKFHEGIWNDPAVLKFVNARHFRKGLQRKEGGKFTEMKSRQKPEVKWCVRDMPGVIGYRRNATFDPKQWLSQGSVNWGNGLKQARRNGHPHVLNVMFAVLKITYSLGFRRVYLLGCDFFMEAGRPYAFDQDKDEGGVQMNNRSYGKLDGMLAMLKPSFDAAGYNVFNCNPSSGLSVFPYEAFDDAIHDATLEMPAEPWDVTGWYNT